MSTHVPLLVLLAMSVLPMQDVTPRAVLLAARDLAYDANYRNDQEGLRSAIDRLQPLASSSSDGAYAHYYLSWAFGARSASQLPPATLQRPLRRPGPSNMHGVDSRLVPPIRSSTSCSPTASSVSCSPINRSLRRLSPNCGRYGRERWAGSEESSRRADRRRHYLQRPVRTERPRAWDRAAERGAATLRRRSGIQVDPLAPRWGHASALATLATFYLRLTRAQTEHARAAAETALRLRADFWYVHQQVLPLLKRSKMP